MNKETYTPWELIPKEAQDSLISDYKALLTSPNEKEREWAKGLEVIFGYHNLNPEPQIKTWEDVEKTEDSNDILLINTLEKYPQTPILKKAIATLKIAKLIDLGYGGMVSEEEALDDNIEKSSIYLINRKIHLHTGICIVWGDRFLTFHSNELGEEFMSYESNRKLVEQYYMM